MPINIPTIIPRIPNLPYVTNPNSPTNRVWQISDANGVFHIITCKEDLDDLIATMTPAQKTKWELAYRFSPVLNDTRFPYYGGTNRDMLS